MVDNSYSDHPLHGGLVRVRRQTGNVDVVAEHAQALQERARARVTSDEPPTAEDVSNPTGQDEVLAWDRRGWWATVGWRVVRARPYRYPRWRPLDPPPG